MRLTLSDVSAAAAAADYRQATTRPPFARRVRTRHSAALPRPLAHPKAPTDRRQPIPARFYSCSGSRRGSRSAPQRVRSLRKVEAMPGRLLAYAQGLGAHAIWLQLDYRHQRRAVAVEAVAGV